MIGERNGHGPVARIASAGKRQAGGLAGLHLHSETPRSHPEQVLRLDLSAQFPSEKASDGKVAPVLVKRADISQREAATGSPPARANQTGRCSGYRQYRKQRKAWVITTKLMPPPWGSGDCANCGGLTCPTRHVLEPIAARRRSADNCRQRL